MAHKKVHTAKGKKTNPKAWAKADAESKRAKTQRKKASSLEQLIAAGPPVGGSKAEEEIRFSFQRRNVTANEALRTFGRMSPGQRAQLQKGLLDRGFYDQPFYSGKRRIAWGVFDTDSLQAFSRALSLAEFSGNLDDVVSGPVTREQEMAVQSLRQTEAEKKRIRRINPVNIENTALKVKDMFAQYMVPISDQAAMSYARQVERGEMGEMSQDEQQAFGS